LPLLLLFSPRRRSNSDNRAISAAFSDRSKAFSLRKLSMTATPIPDAGESSREGVSADGAINTLTRTRP
jgi:hypothetical protein